MLCRKRLENPFAGNIPVPTLVAAVGIAITHHSNLINGQYHENAFNILLKLQIKHGKQRLSSIAVTMDERRRKSGTLASCNLHHN
jgi:hypothetical protein